MHRDWLFDHWIFKTISGIVGLFIMLLGGGIWLFLEFLARYAA